VSIRVVASAEGKKYSNAGWVHHLFETTLVKSRTTKKLAQRFLDCASIKTDFAVPGEPRGIPGLAEADLNDAEYVRGAIQHALDTLVPAFKLPGNWDFRIIQLDNGFHIATNIPFDALNVEYHKTVPVSHSTITPAFLINHLLDARADIQIAAQHMGELVTSPVSSQIIRLKFESISRKREKNVEQFELFQTTHLSNARAIRDAINSGAATFADFLPVLEQASRFKEWLRTRNPDETLLAEYFKAATAETWVEKLPAKSVRLITVAGLGAAVELLFPLGGLGALGSFGIAAADSLLLGRVLKGWRPSQFVEGPLRKFIGSSA